MNKNRYFRGASYQRGFGLGGCCKGSRLGSIQNGRGLGGSLWKFFSPILTKIKNFALPYIKQGSQAVGQEAVNAAADIASDLIRGKRFADTAQERINTGVDKLIMQAQSGRGKQKRKIFGSFQKTNKKPRRLDIFDLK